MEVVWSIRHNHTMFDENPSTGSKIIGGYNKDGHMIITVS